jgi:hypothetical protein
MIDDAKASAARKEAEIILGRKLGKYEGGTRFSANDVGKILAMVMTDPEKPKFLQGFDIANMMAQLALREPGRVRHMWGVDWICVPALSGLNMIVPGRQLTARTFLGIAADSKVTLTWIPTGHSVLEAVHAPTVEQHLAEIEQIAGEAIALEATMRNDRVSPEQAIANEALMRGYKTRLMELCTAPKGVKSCPSK